MLKARITQAQIDAMKAKDKPRLSTVRMLLAAIKQAEVDNQQECTDEEVLVIVKRQVKQLTDSMQSFQEAGRDDLLAEAEAERSVLKEFLPEQMSESELRALVQRMIAEQDGEVHMGKLIGAVMKEVGAKADGATVRTIVQSEIESAS
jgi:uncharacterized protein YqeY